MSTRRLFAAVFLTAIASHPVAAQQVTIGTPNVGVRNSFNEQMGLNFNLNIKGANNIPFDDGGNSAVFGINQFGMPAANGNIQINQGAGPQPAFGGFMPANQTTGGIGFSGSGFSGSLGFSLGQGSNSTITSQTPMVTTFNGQPANFSDQVQQPFVTSVTPVVNGRLQHPRYGYGVMMPRLPAAPPTVSPIYERYRRLKQQGVSIEPRREGVRDAVRNAADRPAAENRFQDRLHTARASSAGQPALSVAEIRRQQAAVADAENAAAREAYLRGLKAENAGKTGVAKIFYRMAVQDASGQLKQDAQQRLQRLSQPSSPGDRDSR